MRVLHIAGGFAQHPLYAHLVHHLRALVRHQTVFAPVRSRDEVARRLADEPSLLRYEYRHILKPLHRVFFRIKIRLIQSELCRLMDPSSFDVVHAHTLYSDGAVALRLKQRFGLPYVVAVRNTDLNVFMRWRPDLRRIGRRVLQEAERVIFISPSYREQLLARLGTALQAVVEPKCSVVPNGLDAHWYESMAREDSSSRTLRLLYVGDLSHNKNIAGTLRATELLASRRPVWLTLVGGSGRGDARRLRRLLSGCAFASSLGRIDDRNQLRSIYREHDIFVMPSFRETFGVVYLEALSQGLPIVHSLGQGIDGFFPPGTVSEAVDPTNPRAIAAGIEALAARLDSVRPMAISAARKFSWSRIARTYAEIYRDIASSGQTEASHLCNERLEGIG